MKMFKYTALGSILPIVSAARALEEFYSSIVERAAGPWQLVPQTEFFSIQEGNFSLMFASMGDTIPWDFVKDLAEKLLLSARLGMANMFDVLYMDDTGQIAVNIALRLVDESGSFSSSGSDYREGSVPSVVSPSD